jgi:hypothetical protein
MASSFIVLWAIAIENTTGLRALGKGHKALGKVFVECHTWHTSHGKILVGKEDFDECFISGTRESLCRVLKKHSAKNEPKKP